MIQKTKLKVKNYLSLVKFSHTIFAMPFAFIGYFLALHQTDAEFDWKLFLFVILCMIFARNAAMAFNRFIDREIDIKNPRTAIREIPSGIIKAKSALLFVIINSVLFITTTYFINELTFKLSPVALLVILGYSITKEVYSALSFSVRFRTFAGSHWCLSGCNRRICYNPGIVFICCVILGEWIRYYLCPARFRLR